MNSQRWTSIWNAVRDPILFVAGLAGITYETLVNKKPPDSTLLTIFAGMMGLPAALGRDRKNSGSTSLPPGSPQPPAPMPDGPPSQPPPSPPSPPAV